MIGNQQQTKIEDKILLAAIFVVPLIITPGFNYDAINVPKLIALVFFGSVLVSTQLNAQNLELLNSYRILTVSICLFLLITVINPFVVNRNVLLQLYGGDGRNTGVFATIFFLIFMVSSIFMASKRIVGIFGKLVVAVGVISSIYGLLQSLGMDPVTWDNPYNEVMGFLGNPNQQSSLLGICSVVTFAFLCSNLISMARKVLLFSLLVFLVYIIIQTNSTQGLIVSVMGSSLVLWIKIKFLPINRVWKISYVILISGIAIYSLLDMLRITSGNYLYKESISLRGDFWRTALQITKDHPVAGIGLDGYADWYRRSRDSVAASRLNLDSVSDSPHNIFLDYLSGGGIPLFIAFLLINVLTLISLIRLYRKLNQFSLEVAILSGVWIGYFLQGLISPIHISLSIWGWITAGLILGLDIKDNFGQGRTPLIKKKSPSSLGAVSPLLRFVGVIIAFAITLPIYRMDHSFRVAFKTAQVQDFQNAANSWPKYPMRLATIGNILLQNNLTEAGKPILFEAVRINPDSYPSWFILNKYPNLTENERKSVVINLKRLEPRFNVTMP
jgi:O-antigen ligase